MSPRVCKPPARLRDADILMTTPTSSGKRRATEGERERGAWQKFFPSPSTASPSCSILKKSFSLDSSFADDKVCDSVSKS